MRQTPHANAPWTTKGVEIGNLDISVKGGVKAPFLWKGRTTAQDWLATRGSPAPWAEIGSDKFALTVPSSMVRGIDDPSKVVDLWDSIIDDVSDMIGVSSRGGRACVRIRCCLRSRCCVGADHMGPLNVC